MQVNVHVFSKFDAAALDFHNPHNQLSVQLRASFWMSWINDQILSFVIDSK